MVEPLVYQLILQSPVLYCVWLFLKGGLTCLVLKYMPLIAKMQRGIDYMKHLVSVLEKVFSSSFTCIVHGFNVYLSFNLFPVFPCAASMSKY